MLAVLCRLKYVLVRLFAARCDRCRKPLVSDLECQRGYCSDACETGAD